MANLEIYDCTLREGAQMDGASFSDRLKIVTKLDEVGADYIELGWPVKSKEILDAFLEARKLKLRKSQLVAFGSTSMAKEVSMDENLEAILKTGVNHACIFGKSWLEHVRNQLNILPEENLMKIYDSIILLKANGMTVFYDAEHFFDGAIDDEAYALSTLDAAVDAGAERIILCDTNGGMMTDEVGRITRLTYEHFAKKRNVMLGVHLHDDFGLAMANTIKALPYIGHIQGTVNGLGERIGNVDLCVILPIMHQKLGIPVDVRLDRLKSLSDLVYDASNMPRQTRQPFFSTRAFRQKGGVHIDGHRKKAVYTPIEPELLGLGHEIVMSSQGGAACVVATAEKFGYSLDKRNKVDLEKIGFVLDELRQLEVAGYDNGGIEAEQFLLIKKHLASLRNFFTTNFWRVETDPRGSKCIIYGSIDGENNVVERMVHGGPIDAAYKVIRDFLGNKYDLTGLRLENYKVRIAKTSGEESIMRTKISFSNGGMFETVGVSGNIIESGIEALKKGFQYFLEQKYKKTKG